MGQRTTLLRVSHALRDIYMDLQQSKTFFPDEYIGMASRLQSTCMLPPSEKLPGWQ